MASINENDPFSFERLCIVLALGLATFQHCISVLWLFCTVRFRTARYNAAISTEARLLAGRDISLAARSSFSFPGGCGPSI